jgi:flagellum-specific ATP synthase
VTIPLEKCRQALAAEKLVIGGSLARVNGTTMEAVLPGAQTGAIYRIPGRRGRADILTEVIGFRGAEAILAPFVEPRGVGPGDPVIPEGMTDEQHIGDDWLGRVVDALARPLDDRPLPEGRHRRPLYGGTPNPLTRQKIDRPVQTGVGVLDVMTTVGLGQRIGLFAGAGVGKSTLLGMLARHSDADVNVVALVGERGREVRAFLEDDLGPEGLARSVVVVATGDASPILRLRAGFLATTIAELYRDRGKNVFLLMDSLTRLAHAAREVGLAAGEPPTTRGYPPSVFSLLPKLLERAGNSDSSGSMTAFYTVLVDGDDMTEPIADAARSTLDGHVVLSRRIAEANRYPAVDIAGSLSRVAQDLISPEHQAVAQQVRQLWADYEEVRDLVQVGAYKAGTDPNIDHVIRMYPRVAEFFKQNRNEKRGLNETLGGLAALLGGEGR